MLLDLYQTLLNVVSIEGALLLVLPYTISAQRALRLVARHFRNVFSFLEKKAFLNLPNEVHLFALHYIYMPLIKKSLEEFTNDWRYHPLSSEWNQSPYQLTASPHSFTQILRLQKPQELQTGASKVLTGKKLKQ